MPILVKTTFNIVCQSCGKTVKRAEIGEYPYTWQFVPCGCGGMAIPDLNSGIEHWIYPASEQLPSNTLLQQI